MAIRDSKIDSGAKVALRHLVVPIITAVSQADVKAFGYKPGFRFEVIDVQAYCLNEAGTVTAQVKIGVNSVLQAALAFAAATRVDGSLVAALASRRGTATQELNVHYTSDGTGVLTNGFVVVTIRPYPMNGDVE